MFFSSLFNVKKETLKRVLLYTGPALLVSMAYMDPGNYGTDIQAGASLNYALLWVVWLSSGMAMLLQYLSGKLGIATRDKSLMGEFVNKKHTTFLAMIFVGITLAFNSYLLFSLLT